MSKRYILIIASFFLIGVFFYQKRQPQLIETELVSVEKGEIRATVSNTRVGTIKACRRAYLAPATGGQVVKLHVKEGDRVEQDQVLLEVWNADLREQVRLKEAEINAAQANAEQTCQLSANADREAQRAAKLFRRDHLISEEAVDGKQSTAKSRQAGCLAARQNVIVGERALKAAQAAMKRTLVTAPFAGTVAEINAELGEYVTPSPPGIPTLPAIDLMDISCLYVSAPIDEVDAPQLKTGMTACVSLDAFPEKRCSGTVSRIAPYVLEKEKQARTVEVEVKLTDPKDLRELLPGYSADIEILVTTKPDVLKVPAEAVQDNKKVLAVEADGTLVEREIQTGLSNWNTVEVLSGLKPGERIVKAIGQDGIKPGVRIKAKP